MRRIIEERLLEWKNNPKRKPLIIDGARQIGKTYTMLDFGKKAYPNTAYFNFEGNRALKAVFAENLQSERILRELSAYSGKSIQRETTLIILDEIQACPSALASLKYFCEQASEYHIVPLECKAADNTKSKSLKSFINTHKPGHAIRISAKNFGFENGIHSVPLYAVFCIMP